MLLRGILEIMDLYILFFLWILRILDTKFLFSREILEILDPDLVILPWNPEMLNLEILFCRWTLRILDPEFWLRRICASYQSRYPYLFFSSLLSFHLLLYSLSFASIAIGSAKRRFPRPNVGSRSACPPPLRQPVRLWRISCHMGVGKETIVNFPPPWTLGRTGVAGGGGIPESPRTSSRSEAGGAAIESF